MRPRAKYAVIYRHRNEYPVSVMCRFFQVSRSGYYDFVHRLDRPEKDAVLAEIIAEQREHSFRTYGYRRMWLVLKKRGINYNPKTILRIMKKYGLLAEIRRRRKWQQMGQQVHKYKNLLNREFYADRPNSSILSSPLIGITEQTGLLLRMTKNFSRLERNPNSAVSIIPSFPCPFNRPRFSRSLHSFYLPYPHSLPFPARLSISHGTGRHLP